MQVHQHKDAMDYKELRNPSQPADTPDGFVSEIRSIIDQARSNAVRSVDFCRVRMYWNIGKRIFEEEQHGKEPTSSGIWPNASNRNMAVGFRCGNWNVADNFTDFIRLRPQCGRN